MKIISGKYKGRVLKGYTLKGTRPTMDRVKESLFATINEKLDNSVCLDLFAGSGRYDTGPGRFSVWKKLRPLSERVGTYDGKSGGNTGDLCRIRRQREYAYV